MGEGHVVLLAVGAWAGAAVARPLPGGSTAVVVVGSVVALALLGRKPWLFVLGVTLLASQLGHGADRAYRPVLAGPHDGMVVVIDEAERLGRGWRLPVRLHDGRRVQAVAFGPDGHRLSRLVAGSSVAIIGRLSPINDTSWARSQHLVGELAVAEVGPSRPPTGLRAGVERLRAVIMAGADPLPRHRQALYTGLVVGEDRLQSDAQRARFRAAGLSHLLAVSGQNVAFVLAVAAVPAAYLPRRGRMVLLTAVLVAFAVATRLEPSVLRATVMAGLSSWATLTGREARGLAPLGLAVTALLLIDPFLVWSVGFRLSVVASAAIVVVGPALAARLPGPEVLVRPVAVTLAAQLGVAPLLVYHFDRVPLASVPANVAAGWAAGFVMVWGLTMGPLAAALPAPIDGWLQAPVVGLLWWLDAVAAWAVRLPLPTVGRSGLVAVVGMVMAGWLLVGIGRRRGAPWPVLALGVMAPAALVVASGTLSVARPPGEATELAGGGRWYPGPDGRAVLVVGADADRRLLDAVLAHRITTIGVVVAERGSGPAGGVAGAVAELTTTGRLLAPSQHRLPGAYRVTSELTLATGHHVLRVEPVANDVRVIEVPP